MIRSSLGVILLLATLVLPVRAQDEPDPARRPEALRQAIETRFAARVQAELGLTADQTDRLRRTSIAHASRRRQLQSEQRSVRRALAAQLRAGEGASPDSVAQLTDRLLNLRVTQAEVLRDEMRELGTFLTPVQRARFFAMRERLLRRAREAREDRRDAVRRRP